MLWRGGGSVGREPAAEVVSAGVVSLWWCGQASLCDQEQVAEEIIFLEPAGCPEGPGVLRPLRHDLWEVVAERSVCGEMT